MSQGSKHHITTQLQKLVRQLATAGVPNDGIAEALGIGERTLRTHYAEELRFGRTISTARVAQRLYQQCMKGNVTAMIFWMKTRGRWTENHGPEENSQRKFEFVFRETAKGEKIVKSSITDELSD